MELLLLVQFFYQGEQGERGLNGDDGLPGPQVCVISWFYKNKCTKINK